MSCSLYRWTPACDGDYCPGDCDCCDKDMEEGYIDCINSHWGGFTGKETCEAGYLVCKGKQCPRYNPENRSVE